MDILQRLRTRFKDSAMEKGYREYYLRQDSVQAAIGVAALMIPIVVFSYSDYIFFGYGPMFYLLAALRGVILVAATAMIVSLLRSVRIVYRDYMLFAWLAANCALSIYINANRPAGFIHHTYIDLLLIVAIYLLFPNPLTLQTAVAVPFTAVNIGFILAFRTDLAPAVLNVIMVSHILGNLMGAYVSWNLHFSRRMQYRHWKTEKDLKEELQEAAENIKTLKGLLPICARCRKVRDDGGYWKNLEDYVQSRMDTTFSHGLCEECEKALYGQEQWYKRRNGTM